MRIYFLAAGVICIVYFFVLRHCTGRPWPTFSRFWLMTGGVHLTVGCAPLPLSVQMFFSCMAAAAWALLFLGTIVILSAGKNKKEQAACIIVLGAFVNGTTLSAALRSRLDEALRYLSVFPGTMVVVSGGQGPDESVSEADAMAEYLITKGIGRDKIIREDRSVTTRENLRFSRKLSGGDRRPVGIVTNDFHMFRTLLLARQEGYRCVIPVPAPSDPVFLPNYLVREILASAATVFSGILRDQKTKEE